MPDSGPRSPRAPMEGEQQDAIVLAPGAPLRDYQRYVHELEAMHGWLDVDLIHNCFLLGEEMGELFKAIRKHERYYDQAPEGDAARGADAAPDAAAEASRAHVAEELVDVFNYVLALSNRLNIDLEAAFREKNSRNQRRRWT